MPANPSLLFLSPSTSLHRAIETGNTDVARFLPGKVFHVDVFPLVAVTKCMNPLMFSLVTQTPDLSWYELLSASSHANHDQLIPIFKVHIPHIAWITLSVPALEAIATALSHTLLHITCLPSNDSSITHFSHKIHHSIHSVRSLPPTSFPMHYARPTPQVNSLEVVHTSKTHRPLYPTSPT
jgi:hypothetical protein